ncbi:MAG: (deoxy)nucleoside triphosphate pyrophosphohydrolase [Clostridia bacterium]|nr:(deoxy)nucleoside triphosphate pyrophosphohydrolase [Clostridia bacterium]
MKTIQVAAALILSEGRVFATQRGYGAFKDYWEFPGGKIERGETPQQALAREIREELETIVSVEEKVFQVEYDYPDFHLSMGCWRCTVLSGHLTLTEHESARWLGPRQLDSVGWLPADLQVIPRLKALLENMKTEA